MKKVYISAITLLLAILPTMAQETFDLLKYNQQDVLGTARSMSMSNAMGAVGADVTAISINPAGLGIYRSGDVNLTLNLANTKVLSSSLVSDNTKFNVSSFGYVFASDMHSDDELAFFNMAITYNRQANHFRNSSIRQYASPISILDNLYEGDPLESLAYTTYLLDKEYNPILQAGEKVDYSQRVIESGSSGVWDFSMAFNYAYWLYLGFSVGVQHLDYTMTSFYHEDFELGGSMDYNNKFNSSGLGYNVKVGGIIRPFPALRLGVAYHSPTVYVMTDDIVFAEMNSYGVPNDAGALVDASARHKLEYRYYTYDMNTPQKVILSAALQLGKRAMLSVDYEMLDYTTMNLYDTYGFVYEDVRQDIQRKLNNVRNLRLGAEWRLNDVMSLRGGYAYMPSPVKSSVITDHQEVFTPSLTPHYSIIDNKGTSVYSLGLGLRFDDFYLDFAYQNRSYGEQFYPYYNWVKLDGEALPYNNASYLKTTQNNFAMTLGMRF
ncbi:MAG: outer membrane protein transport protein [Bacteroidales bacterium]|nr:outer membrane protein transport protein [Bacteroidales bacterium]